MNVRKISVALGAAALGFTLFAEEPDEFVDYVQANGTQFFDTGVIGKANTRVVIDWMMTSDSYPSGGTYMMGAYKSGDHRICPLYYNSGFGEYYGGKLSNRSGLSLFKRAMWDMTFEKGQQTLYYNGVLTAPNAGHSNVEVDTGLSMFLFACNNGSSTNIVTKGMRVYSLKIWQSETKGGTYEPVRDYRPCRKNGKVGLYDDVEKTIIYPLGAGGVETTVAPTEYVIYPTTTGGKTPFEQLKAALEATAPGDIITLKRGVYSFGADDYMADNKQTGKASYCKIHLNVTTPGLTIQGEDFSSRETWKDGAEPVILDGTGTGKIMQVQIAETADITIRNIAFANGFGGLNQDSLYGNWCNGGAIGFGMMANPWRAAQFGIVTNCVFRGNSSAIGGAIGTKCASSGSLKAVSIYDCFFTNNVGESSAGCLYNGNVYGCDFVGNGSVGEGLGIVRDCHFAFNDPKKSNTILGAASVSNCVFATNSISSMNWTGTVVGSKLIANCDFVGNRILRDGIVSSGGMVTNCTFVYNTVGNQGNGAIKNPEQVIDCSVVGTRGYYGAAIIVDKTNYHCVAKNCYFADNSCSAGGCGAYLNIDLKGATAADVAGPYMTFDHCTFETNSISSGIHGGAIFNGTKNLPDGVELASLIVCSNGCQFLRNHAAHVSGVEGVTAIGCTFVSGGTDGVGFNYVGDNAAKSRLVDCDFTGGNFYRCSMDRCTVHMVTNAPVFNSWNYVTNTLVTDCVIPSGCGVFGHYTAQQAADAGGEYVNCTFAGIKGTTFYKVDCKDFAFFKNCVFANNTNNDDVATSLSMDYATRNALRDGVNPVVYDHCAYGPLAGTPLVPDPTGEGVFLCTNPRFNAGREPDSPYYEPRASSPLKNAGDNTNVGFTADDTDLAGRKRLNGGLDIGCYESYMKSKGFVILYQ